MKVTLYTKGTQLYRHSQVEREAVMAMEINGKRMVFRDSSGTAIQQPLAKVLRTLGGGWDLVGTVRTGQMPGRIGTFERHYVRSLRKE